jgi:hypothetical protein
MLERVRMQEGSISKSRVVVTNDVSTLILTSILNRRGSSTYYDRAAKLAPAERLASFLRTQMSYKSRMENDC